MTEALCFARPIAVKRANVTAEGTFAGYASTFGGPPDRVGDVIMSGAFQKSISEQSSGAMPGMLWAHDMAEPIGRWTKFAEDQRGLRAEGQLTLALQRAKDAHALLRDDALSLSIGYRIRPGGATYERDTRIVKDVELFEVSLVAVPANPRAQVTSVKDIRGPADLQRALMELGYSQREAKRIVAGGWSALRRDDSPPSELTQAAALLRQRAAAIAKG